MNNLRLGGSDIIPASQKLNESITGIFVVTEFDFDNILRVGSKLGFSREGLKMKNLPNFMHWCRFTRFKILYSKVMRNISIQTQIKSQNRVLKFQNFVKCTQLGIGFYVWVFQSPASGS